MNGHIEADGEQTPTHNGMAPPEPADGGNGAALLPSAAGRFGDSCHDEPFNWSRDESVIINDQPATAVYWNSQDQLVIRQERAWDRDEDSFVVVDRAHLAHLIAILKTEAGG